jgi:hypothetical protein
MENHELENLIRENQDVFYEALNQCGVNEDEYFQGLQILNHWSGNYKNFTIEDVQSEKEKVPEEVSNEYKDYINGSFIGLLIGLGLLLINNAIGLLVVIISGILLYTFGKYGKTINHNEYKIKNLEFLEKALIVNDLFFTKLNK